MSTYFQDEIVRGSRDTLLLKGERLRVALRRQREEAVRCREESTAQCLDSMRLVRRARRLCFDRHGPIVCMWTDDLSKLDQAGLESHVDSDELRNEIRRLFTITVKLSSILTLNRDAEIDRRVRGVIYETDEAIKSLRLAASGNGSSPNNGEAQTGGQVSPNLLAPMYQIGLIIDGMLESALARGESGVVDLTEASQALHRAVIALDAALTTNAGL